ncbi:MAG: hypothetical protein H6712_11490 [Myxococcales bacterium]|nr:hypothetical protein [Myxococcales bacterium]
MRASTRFEALFLRHRSGTPIVTDITQSHERASAWGSAADVAWTKTRTPS